MQLKLIEYVLVIECMLEVQYSGGCQLVEPIFTLAEPSPFVYFGQIYGSFSVDMFSRALEKIFCNNCQQQRSQRSDLFSQNTVTRSIKATIETVICFPPKSHHISQPLERDADERKSLVLYYRSP